MQQGAATVEAQFVTAWKRLSRFDNAPGET